MTLAQRIAARLGYVPAAEATKTIDDLQASAGRVIADLQAKALSQAAIIYQDSARRGAEHPANLENALELAWRHSYFAACLTFVANACSRVPLRVMQLQPSERRRSLMTVADCQSVICKHARLDWRSREAELHAKGMEGEEVAPGHPLRQLLEKVNPRETWSEFCQKTLMHLQPAGNAYWRLIGLQELWTLRPDRVTIVPSTADIIQRYDYRINGKDIPLKPDEVIHFRNPDPMNDYYGRPLASNLDLELMTDWYRKQYGLRFFENGAALGGIIRPLPGQIMTEEQADEVAEQFRTQHGGIANMRKIAITSSYEFQEMGHAPRDADFLRMAEQHERDISAVVGVNPSLVGRTKDVNRSNLDGALVSFWSHTGIPWLTVIAGQINEFLAPRFGPNVYVEFDFSGIEVLQESQTAKAERARADYQAGIATLAEARADTDREAIEGTELIRVTTGEAFVAPEELPGKQAPPPAFGGPPPGKEPEEEEPEEEQPEASPEKEPVPPATKSAPAVHIRKDEFGDEYHVKAWRRYDSELTRQEDECAQAVADYAARQRDDILRKLGVQKGLKASQPSTGAVLFDVDEAGEAFWQIVKAEIARAALLWGGDTLAIANIGIDWTWSTHNPLVDKYLREKRLIITTIPAEWHEALRLELQAGLAAGEPMDVVAGRIEQFYTGLVDQGKAAWMSRRIAQTEMGSAMNHGALVAMADAEVERKMWLATLDDRVRDAHSLMHGKTVALDEQFEVDGATMYGPGDPNGGPRNVCNCRCALSPVVDTGD